MNGIICLNTYTLYFCSFFSEAMIILEKNYLKLKIESKIYPSSSYMTGRHDGQQLKEGKVRE